MDRNNTICWPSDRIASLINNSGRLRRASTEFEVSVLISDSISHANSLGLLMTSALLIQTVLIGAWAFIWQKRRQNKLTEATIESDRRFYSFYLRQQFFIIPRVHFREFAKYIIRNLFSNKEQNKEKLF